jgi:IS4 transposase
MVITTGTYSELTIARRQAYSRGTILIMDKGFLDFRWFYRLHQSGVFFVTRIKSDTGYEVVQQQPVASGGKIIADQLMRCTSRRSRKRYPQPLRLVTIQTDTGERLQFLTNHMTLAATTIADVYKDRWQIEVFFKLLKQNLRVKSFIGASANAVWTQIWTAMIAMLLVKFLQLKSKTTWCFSNLIYFLRMNLLVYRDLWAWLNDPFTAPPGAPPAPVAQQLDLPWR